jgi:hypothetical protein
MYYVCSHRPSWRRGAASEATWTTSEGDMDPMSRTTPFDRAREATASGDLPLFSLSLAGSVTGADYRVPFSPCGRRWREASDDPQPLSPQREREEPTDRFNSLKSLEMAMGQALTGVGTELRSAPCRLSLRTLSRIWIRSGKRGGWRALSASFDTRIPGGDRSPDLIRRMVEGTRPQTERLAVTL